jgi:hypothetical protein
METQKTRIIGITLVMISVASVIACAGVISHYNNVTENPNNDSFCQSYPPITQEELTAGWYYGQLNQKKPGTPDTWLHKGEGTKSAMWFNPTILGYMYEQSEDPDDSIVLEFQGDCCDNVNVDPWNQSQLGISEITWIDETTVYVMAYVSTNCAEWIEGAGFYIYNDTIHLVYYVGNGGVMAHCICVHSLSFTLRNLEPKEYKFGLEPMSIDHPTMIIQ